jgi:hypothetical protein
VSGRQVRCRSFTPGSAGHGTLLTSGWGLPNGYWSLIDLDKFGSVWKFNDFTFGTRQSLVAAMQINRPILAYHG